VHYQHTRGPCSKTPTLVYLGNGGEDEPPSLAAHEPVSHRAWASADPRRCARHDTRTFTTHVTTALDTRVVDRVVFELRHG
jgi:hypothetical protein